MEYYYSKTGEKRSTSVSSFCICPEIAKTENKTKINKKQKRKIF